MTLELVRPAKPEIHLATDVYDPDLNPTGTIVPRVGALVNNSGYGRWVIAVNEVTYKPSYGPFVSMIVTDGEDLVSTVSYGNDIFYVFYSNLSNPKTLTPNRRMVVYGHDVSKYRIIRYPDTSESVVISRYYDTDGNFTSELVPLTQEADGSNTWFCNQCKTTATLTTGERVKIEFFNDAGTLIAFVMSSARESVMINETPADTPIITNVQIRSSQERAPGQIYMTEKQDLESLNLTVWVSFNDGRTVQFPVDNQKTFLYGTEDLISSYAGMEQRLTAKVMLGPSDLSDPAITVNSTHVAAEATVTIISNGLAAPIKISVMPRWNIPTNRYVLHYSYYTTDRDQRLDITSLVSISSGSFDGALYGVNQSFVISVDMSLVDPTIYTESTIYQQNVIIQLQPYAAYQRWTIRTALSSSKVYGVDASSNRRPVIYYDSDRQQYFIPASIFQTSASMLRSFYESAEPPYNTETETGPLVPTHFVMRDLVNGSTVTPSQIEISAYGVAFSIGGTGSAGRYLDGTVIVEFLQRIDISTTLILYGVPVDVRAGTYTS